jgi:ABC-type uncharacterized transport system ATPase subunit
MKGITKRFGELAANDDVDLEVGEGEVVALLGENGAGKSTLMKILYGFQSPDSGTIEIEGKPVRFSSPRDAMAASIGMVFQQFSLIPALTVRENLQLAYPDLPMVPARGGGQTSGCWPTSSAWLPTWTRPPWSPTSRWARCNWWNWPRC